MHTAPAVVPAVHCYLYTAPAVFLYLYLSSGTYISLRYLQHLSSCRYLDNNVYSLDRVAALHRLTIVLAGALQGVVQLSSILAFLLAGGCLSHHCTPLYTVYCTLCMGLHPAQGMSRNFHYYKQFLHTAHCTEYLQFFDFCLCI